MHGNPDGRGRQARRHRPRDWRALAHIGLVAAGIADANNRPVVFLGRYLAVPEVLLDGMTEVPETVTAVRSDTRDAPVLIYRLPSNITAPPWWIVLAHSTGGAA